MISYHLDLRYQIQRINARLNGKSCHIQKSYASSKTLCLQVRIPGETLSLVLGKGNRYEGLSIVGKPPKSEIRLRDRLLEYVRKTLVSSSLLRIELDESDRIFTIIYFKNGHEHFFSFFYHARKTYFSHALCYGEFHEVFNSWSKGKLKINDYSLAQHYEIFNDVGRQKVQTNQDRDPKDFPVQEVWKFEEESLTAKKDLNKLTKKRDRKLALIEKDLEQSLKWVDLQLYGQKVSESELEDGKQEISGLKFNFGFGKKFYEKREMIFNRSKRLKKAEGILKKRLMETQEKKIQIKNFSGIDRKHNVEVQWSKKESILEVEKDGAIEFSEFNGVRYGIGLSALGNDQLRSRHAKREHWWFHSEFGTSPHVIVMSEHLTDETIKRASYLVFAQQVKKQPELGEIDMIYTQVKFLRSVKGQAGKVLFKKEKRRRFFLDNFSEYLDN